MTPYPAVTAVAARTNTLRRSHQRIVEPSTARRSSAPPIVGVPRFFMWPSGIIPASRTTWPICFFCSSRMNHGESAKQMQHRGHRRRDDAERDVPEHVEPPQPARRVAQRVEELVNHPEPEVAEFPAKGQVSISAATTRSAPTEREPFTRTTSEGSTRAAASRAASSVEAAMTQVIPSSAARSRDLEIRPPQPIARATPAAREDVAEGQVLGLGVRPELLHLAEDGDASGGRRRSRRAWRARRACWRGSRCRCRRGRRCPCRGASRSRGLRVARWRARARWPRWRGERRWPPLAPRARPRSRWRPPRRAAGGAP